MALYGKVLRIFDDTSLLVNIGSREGLKRGNIVVVIEKGGEITDPESGESLGELELIKAELVAVDVQEKISILKVEPEISQQVNLPLSAQMVRDSVKPGTDKKRMEVVRGEISGLPAPSPVREGDVVRVIE